MTRRSVLSDDTDDGLASWRYVSGLAEADLGTLGLAW